MSPTAPAAALEDAAGLAATLRDGGSVEAVLRDGAPVEVRRLRRSDAPLLASAFERLSAESRRLRFIASKDRLSNRELRYLTDVDGHHHEALAATDPRTGEGIAVARFVRLEDEPQVAEVAVTVVDEWQHRGLGTLLLELLTERARQEGLTHFSALISSDNTTMLDLLRRAGGAIEPVAGDASALEYRTALGSGALGGDLRDALRSAADGRLGIPVRLRELLVGIAEQAGLARRGS